MPNSIPEFFALSPWKNPPSAERILELIWQLQDACEQQVWRDHWHEDEPNCPCLWCEHAGGLWYFLRQSEAIFEGQVYTFPALSRRRADRAREAGTPRDMEYAAQQEAQADELENEAEPPTERTETDAPPAVVILNQLKAELDARADTPIIARIV